MQDILTLIYLICGLILFLFLIRIIIQREIKLQIKELSNNIYEDLRLNSEKN